MKKKIKKLTIIVIKHSEVLQKYFSEMEGILSGRNILGLCPAPTILEQNNKTKAIVLRGTQNNF